jgi:hypothetical protein
MYREMTEEEDKKMAQRWQKDANGILIFVSLQHSSYPTSANIKNNRPAYSLLRLRY